MQRNGLYLADGSFMRFPEQRSSAGLSAEIATRSRSLDYYSLGNLYLPNPDPVLKKQGKDIQVYTDLLTDDRVGGSLTNRINATMALDWEIDRGKSAKSRQAKFVKEVFSRLPLNTIIEQTIRNPRGFGYGPAETLWVKRGDGLNAPVDVVYKPQHWFVFGVGNELRFLSREQLLTGEELPPRRFLCPTNEATYANPYGLGNLSRCFWPVVFKKGGGWQFRIKYAEKFGAVWPVGKLPRSATQDQIDDMLEILEDMINDGVAVIPDDGSVEFLESASKGGTSDLFSTILADANSAISTVWLGHAGAGQSVSGSLGGEEMAVEVRKDLRDSDKTLVEATLNKLIDYICEENWGSAEGAPRFCLWEEEDVDKVQSERDEKLTAAMEKSGLKLTQVYYERTYNLQPGDVEVKQEPAVVPATPVATPVKFAEAAAETFPDQEILDKFIAGLTTPAELQQLMEGVLKPVFRAVAEGGDLQELFDELPKLFPQMDTSRIEEILGRVFFVASVWGRLSAEEEAK